MQNIIWFFLFWMLLLAVGVVLLLYYWYQRSEQKTDVEVHRPYDEADFSDRAGFAIVEYPDNEIMIPVEYWLVDDATGKITYNVVPDNYVELRAAPVGQLSIPAEYRQEAYDSVTQYEIDGITVTQSHSPGSKGMLSWQREEFDYTILAAEPEMTLLGGISDEFVTKTRAEQTRL